MINPRGDTLAGISGMGAGFNLFRWFDDSNFGEPI
jgi:hypothetical protein